MIAGYNSYQFEVSGLDLKSQNRRNLKIEGALLSGIRISIGWDYREDIAYKVVRQSLRRHASAPASIEPIQVQELVDKGLIPATPARWRRPSLLAAVPGSPLCGIRGLGGFLRLRFPVFR